MPIVSSASAVRIGGTVVGGGGAPPPEQSASCIVAKTATGSHTFTIDGYSRITQQESSNDDGREIISSGTFTVGGHTWCVEWLPGTVMSQEYRCDRAADSDDWIFLLLRRVHCTSAAGDGDEQASANFTFSLLDHNGQPTYGGSRRLVIVRTFSDTMSWAVQFVDTKYLDSSSMAKTYLRGDRLRVRCEVTVYEDLRCKDLAVPSRLVAVPPPDIGDHLARLLATGVGADLAFVVAGVKFAAHRRILAVRAPELLQEIVASGCSCPMMKIGGVEEAMVFKALLHYIYTGSLPPEVDDDEGETKTDMARHLIAAADRYSLDRLRLICEDMLWRRVDISTVAATLAVAEQHSCLGLKKACVGFLMSGSNLKAAMAAGGFECLRSSCPSVLKELLLAMVDRR